MKRKTHAWAYIVFLLVAFAMVTSGCASSKTWAYTKEKAWPDVKAVVLVHAPSIALNAIDDILGLIGIPISAVEWGVQSVESVVVPAGPAPTPAPNP
jgi:hypothetical protein